MHPGPQPVRTDLDEVILKWNSQTFLSISVLRLARPETLITWYHYRFLLGMHMVWRVIYNSSIFCCK